MGWISSNLAAIGIVGSSVAFSWSVVAFVLSWRAEQRSREFEHYHRLIKELVSPDETGSTWIDRQVAVVFELRHFRRYFEVTARVLSGLEASWSTATPSDAMQRLIREINLTQEYMRRMI